ncbi:MAG TPA: hypothetical protein DHV59_13845 [Oxalobacteraceae bacterium]|nr:hypothetical protein [Oxalobacteraceae bacterium]
MENASFSQLIYGDEMNLALLVSGNPAQSMAFSTAIYLNEIPDFAGNELQRLYGHIHSSLPFMQIFRPTGQVSTYVARHGATPTAILLFRLAGRSVVVLNQTMQIDREELRQFAACVFEQFPFVGVISFKAIQTDLLNFPYPLQRGHAMEDIIITLPATAGDYTAGLGKSTRSNLKYYKAKLEKNFSSFRFQSYEKEEIDEQLVYDLIKLSEARITAKKINFGIDSEYARCIVELTKLCGVVNAIWVDGQLCAGAISYRTGADQTTEVIAHDEKYHSYSPGMLCFYLAICESIAKGVRKYHLGGGRLDYKVRLSGFQQNMEEVQLYRPYWGMVLNCDWVAKTLFNAGILHLKTWLRSHETSLAVRLLLQSRYVMRKVIGDICR